MGFQKIEFEFPDDDGTDIEVESSSAETLESEGEKKAAASPKQVVEDEVELEVVDDTPEADKNRKPSDAPEEVTEEELENYSDKVRNRIKHFTKGYHDERRAKEAAIRERTELERVTKGLMEEVNQLKTTGNKSQTALLQQAKKNADGDYDQAKVAYKKAYEAGDGDKLLEAQEALTTARMRVDKVNSYKVPPLQTRESGVEVSNNDSSRAQPAVEVDERAAKWSKENAWFNTDTEMTSYALGLHNKLVNEEKLDPKSDNYYERINARMRELFPDKFEDEGDKPSKHKSSNVVAPASRSKAPKKVRLTQTQVRLAKRLGITPEQYAKQVALDMRKDG